jgi:hypothetical protein
MTPSQSVFTARFYGHVIHQEGGHDMENHLESVRQVCEDHRARVLPRIVEFEAWLQRRYGIDLNRPPLGPVARRDRVRDLIRQRGEWTLPIKHPQAMSSTLGDIFAELYESAEAMCHESGDGV